MVYVIKRRIGSSRSYLAGFAARDILKRVIHIQATVLCCIHHQVCALRRPAHPQHCIAACQQTLGDRVKDLVEHGVADTLRAGERDEWKREPFADNGNVAPRRIGRANASIARTFAASLSGSSPVPER